MLFKPAALELQAHAQATFSLFMLAAAQSRGVTSPEVPADPVHSLDAPVARAALTRRVVVSDGKAAQHGKQS